jgi:glutathione S-transferase
VEAKLFGLRGAPPSYTAELMLRHKGIEYERVNLFPTMSARALARQGFSGRTAPAMLLNGRQVQTNRAIARALDELVPDPPLFPSDPEARAAVEEAERFGDEILQHATRRMTLWSLTQDRDSVNFHPTLGALPVPRFPKNARLRNLLMFRIFRHYGISKRVVGDDSRALPWMLDRLDDYVGAGVLNGPQLTAADYEIAPLVAMLLSHNSLKAEIAARPVAALANRVLPR